MLTSLFVHWRNAQTANSSTAHVSKAKIDHGSTAPKTNGPSNSTTQALLSSAVLVSLGCETLATGAGSGCVARAELTDCPWNQGNRRANHRRAKVQNRRAIACPELGNLPGNARWP